MSLNDGSKEVEMAKVGHSLQRGRHRVDSMCAVRA